MKQRIAILGSQGTLAEALQQELAPHKYEVHGFSRQQCDITHADIVRALLCDVRPDAVINTSAYNNVDACEVDSNQCLQALAINATAVGKLASLTDHMGIPLIHYSTNYVFDGSDERDMEEDEFTHSIGLYGWTKEQGEINIARAAQHHYILRVACLFGKQGSGKSTKRSFADIVLGLAEKQQTLKLISDEVSNPTYAKDVAKQTRYILEQRPSYGIYHTTNTGKASWLDYGNEVLRIAGIDRNVESITSQDMPRPAKRPPHAVLANTKLSPMRPWQEALEEYMRENGLAA